MTFRALLAAYAVLFTVLAVNPLERDTWFAENLTVWIIVGLILLLRRRGVTFTPLAYGLMFVLVFLHTIGGHYTFARVPFGWVTDLFGFQRNHYDRIAHFSVGLYAFAIAEWLDTRRLVANRLLLALCPVAFIAAIAALYEIIEWIYAVLSDPAAGDAFLGAFAFGLASGLDAVEAAKLSVACASKSVERLGTQSSYLSREDAAALAAPYLAKGGA